MTVRSRFRKHPPYKRNHDYAKYFADTGFNVRSLFSQGEQGAWYDPSDLTSMYQDSTGVTPAAINQPVGFIGDKRLGMARSSESWNNATAAVSGEASVVSPGVYRIFSSAGANSFVQVLNVLTVGKFYEVTFTIDSVTNAGGGVGPEGSVTPAFSTVGTKRAIIQAGTAHATIKRASSATDIQVSGVSFREIPGNHAFQSTSASRPTLSARYNLLTVTENFADGANWTKNATTCTADSVTEDGTVAAQHYVQKGANSTGTHKLSLDFKQSIGTRNIAIRATGASGSAYVIYNPSTGATVTSGVTGSGHTISSVDAATTASGGYFRGSFTVASTETVTFRVQVADGTSLTFDGDSVSTVGIRRPDIRTAADAALNIPAYQRVNTATDYDTAGFPMYLSADGVDDFMLTGSVDYTAYDKVSAWAGIGKLSDAAAGVLCELGPAAGPGSFSLLAAAGASSTLAFRTIGSSADANAATSAAYPAPAVVVMSGQGSIPDDQRILRVNSVQVAINLADQGGGTLTNNPMYLFRRGGTSLPYTGRLYQLIIRTGISDLVTLLAGERFTGSKMGIAL